MPLKALQKWENAVNVTAAEPSSCEKGKTRIDRLASEKPARAPKKMGGFGFNACAATVEATNGGDRRRRC
jgi:hypothetical protein